LPPRGLVAAALLIGGALVALASLRRLERQHRLLGRLRQEEAQELALDSLSEDDRYTASELARAGVVQITGRRVQVRPADLATFRARRARLLLSGVLVALVLISLVVLVVLRH
jgi:hypothetical protein